MCLLGRLATAALAILTRFRSSRLVTLSHMYTALTVPFRSNDFVRDVKYYHHSFCQPATVRTVSPRASARYRYTRHACCIALGASSCPFSEHSPVKSPHPSALRVSINVQKISRSPDRTVLSSAVTQQFSDSCLREAIARVHLNCLLKAQQAHTVRW